METRYQKRISGPLLDRVDIHAEVPRVDFDKLADDRLGEPSKEIRQRVEVAREHQTERFNDSELVCNADMGPSEVRVYCKLDSSGRALVRQAMTQLQLTARAFHRVLKLARTIADLGGETEILTPHLAEALQYRPRRWT
jgi:magnesium chelatase family protein